MKSVEIRVSKEESDIVGSILGELGLPYSKSTVDTEGDKATLYSTPCPDEMLDNLLSLVSAKVDFRKKINLLITKQITASISPPLQKIQQRVTKSKPAQNPIESILQRTEKYLRPSSNILIMTALATIVALAGLFLNNIAIVIGGMLISPFLGPINAVSINTSLGRVKQLLRAEGTILALVFLSIAISALVTLVSSKFITLELTSQIITVSTTNILDTIIAFFLGVASGLALVTDLPEILVGVAVAVALVPPAAVTGIGLALDQPSIFVGSLLITLTSLYGLNAGEIMLLLLRGVSPRRYYQKAQAKKFSNRAFWIFLSILLLLAILIIISHR